MDKKVIELLKMSYGLILFIAMIVSIVTMTSHPVMSRTLDTIIWTIFLVDTLWRLIKSKQPWQFIKKHPFDILALIPIYNGFRFFKLIPMIASVIRFSTVGKRYLLPFVTRLNMTGIGRILLYFMLIFFILPIPLVFIEPTMNHSYGTVLWWALQTVTTVGYGDIVPTTMAGKLIASILMILGVGLISTLTSSLTSALGTQPIFSLKTEVAHHKKENIHGEEAMNRSENHDLSQCLNQLSIEDIDRMQKILTILKEVKQNEE